MEANEEELKVYQLWWKPILKSTFKPIPKRSLNKLVITLRLNPIKRDANFLAQYYIQTMILKKPLNFFEEHSMTHLTDGKQTLFLGQIYFILRQDEIGTKF